MATTRRRVTGITLLILVLATALSTLAATPAAAIGIGCGGACKERVPDAPAGNVYE